MQWIHSRFRFRAGFASVAAIAVAGLVIAGCGSSSSSDSTASSDGGEKTADNGTLCVSSLVGYSIVPDLLKTWSNAAEANGMKYTSAIADPEGDVQSSQANLESCVRDEAKVAVNITTPDETLAPSIQKLGSNGDFYIGQYSGEPVAGQALSFGPNDEGMSKQLFDFAEENLVKTGEKPTVLAITSSAIPVVVVRVGEFVRLAEEAGWNVVGPIEIEPVNVAQQTASKTAAALRSNPDINMMLAFTDEVTSGAEPAIRDAGADVNILSFEGLEPTYSKMREGNSLVAAVAAAPMQVYNDYSTWAVSRMLGDEWEADTVTKCLGTVVTPENVPPPNTLNQGGECVENGTSYSADELTKLAEETAAG
jgi:ABC-type sugar transport system substrate-binding protein